MHVEPMGWVGLSEQSPLFQDKILKGLELLFWRKGHSGRGASRPESKDCSLEHSHGFAGDE